MSSRPATSEMKDRNPALFELLKRINNWAFYIQDGNKRGYSTDYVLSDLHSIAYAELSAKDWESLPFLPFLDDPESRQKLKDNEATNGS